MKKAEILYQRNLFDAIQKVGDLEQLLQINLNTLWQICSAKQYNKFYIPKKNGTARLIENPNRVLKDLLKKLNFLLQCSYTHIRPKCVHGFTIRKGSQKPRNIISNAKKHINQNYLLNIDLKDFFHSVKEAKIKQLFLEKLGKTDANLISILTKLVTLDGRLPMGSPTSPVISNFALLDVDEELEALAGYLKYNFTRFADDLSFSSNERFTPSDIYLIKDAIKYHGFEINPDKLQLFGPKDVKIVTGLVVTDKVELPPNYLVLLEKEIFRFKEFMLLNHKYHTQANLEKINRIKMEIRGKWNFAHMVMPSHELVKQLKLQMEYAFNPIEDFESTNWLDMPYLFF